MKEELKKLKTFKEKFLYVIGLEIIKEEDPFELDEDLLDYEEEKLHKEPTICFIEKRVKINPEILESDTEIEDEFDILIPDYLLDEKDNFTTKINYDLIPENKRKLVKTLGPVCLRLVNGGMAVFPLPFPENSDLKYFLSEHEIGCCTRNWDDYADRYLSYFLADQKNNEKHLNYFLRDPESYKKYLNYLLIQQNDYEKSKSNYSL